MTVPSLSTIQAALAACPHLSKNQREAIEAIAKSTHFLHFVELIDGDTDPLINAFNAGRVGPINVLWYSRGSFSGATPTLHLRRFGVRGRHPLVSVDANHGHEVQVRGRAF